MVLNLKDKEGTLSGKGFNFSLFGMLENTGKQDAEALERIGKAISELDTAPIDAYNAEMGNLSVTSQKFAKELAHSGKGAKEISQGFTTAAKSASKLTFASKAATLGMKALSVAGNMIAGFGIGIAIDLLIKGITALVQAQENAIAKAREVSESLKEQREALSKSKSTLTEVSSEYETLAKGIDKFGNNISLTSDEYKRYLELSQKFSDMFPNLITYHTDMAGVVTAEKVSVEELTQAYKEQQEAYYGASLIGAKDLYNGLQATEGKTFFSKETWTNATSLGKQIDEAKKLIDEIDKSDFIRLGNLQTGNEKDSRSVINGILNEEVESINAINEILRDAGLKGLDLSFRQGNKENLEEYNKYLSDNIANIRTQYRILLTETQTASTQFKMSLSGFLYFDEDYSSFTQDTQKTIDKLISSLDYNFFTDDKFKSETDIFNWVKTNFITPLTDPEIANEINNAFTGLMSLDDIQDISYGNKKSMAENYVEQIVKTLNLSDEDKDKIIGQYIKGFEEIDNAIQHIIIETNFTPKQLDSLSEEQIRILYSLDNIGSLSFDDAVKKINEVGNEAKKAEKQLDFSQIFSSFTELSANFNNGTISSEKYTESLKKQLEDVNALIASNPELANKYKLLADIINRELSSTPEILKELRSSTDSLISSASTLSSAFKEQAENGQLSIQSTLSIVDAGYAAALSIDAETGAVRLSADAYLSLTKMKLQEQILSLQSNRSLLSAKIEDETKEINTLTEAYRYLADAKIKEALVEAQKQKTNAFGDFESINAQIAVLEKLQGSLDDVIGGSFSSGSKSAASKETDAWKEAFEKLYKELQYQRDKHIISEEEYYVKLTGLNEKYFKDRKEYLDDYRRYELEAENGLLKLWEDRMKSQGNAYIERVDKEIKKLNEQKKIEEEFYDKKIEALQEQKEALKEQQETEDKLLAIEEKREALIKAQTQRNSLVFKDGKFEYMADQEAVDNAQKDFDDAQKDFEQYEIEKELDNQIKKYQEAKKNATDSIDKQIEKWEDLKESVNEQLSLIGEDLALHQENVNLTAEIELMFTDGATAGYNNMAAAVANYVDTFISKMEELRAYRESIKGSSGGGGVPMYAMGRIGGKAETAIVDENEKPEIIARNVNGRLVKLEYGDSVLPASFSEKFVAAMNGNMFNSIQKNNLMSFARPDINFSAIIPQQTVTPNITIGDIKIMNPIGNTDGLALEIKNNFSAKMKQALYKK